jgi:hypothetical protein
LSLPPFLEQFQQVSFFHLHTCVHNIWTIFTLLYPLPISSPFPLVLIPQAGPVLPSFSLYNILFLVMNRYWIFKFIVNYCSYIFDTAEIVIPFCPSTSLQILPYCYYHYAF